MELANLVLRDWRCHEDLTLALAPVTLITGGNGMGKTSLQDALEFVFSGCSQYSDERGQLRNGARVVREGAKTASVSLSLPDGQTIERSIPPHRLSLSWSAETAVTKAQAVLDLVVGCTPERARLSLRTGRHFGQEAKKRQDTMTKLLRLEPEPEHITAELKALAKESGLTLLPVLKAAGCTATSPLGKIQAACKELLTDVKKAHKTAQGEHERLKTEWDALDDECNPPTEDQLREARQAVKQAAERVGAERVRQQAIERAQNTLEDLRQLVATAEAKPVDVAGLQKKREIYAGAVELIRKDRARLDCSELSKREAAGELVMVQARLRGLAPALAGEGMCPFREGHPCAGSGGDRAQLQAEADALQARAAELEPVANQDVAAELAAIRARLEKGEAKLREVTAELAEARANDAARLRAELEREEAVLAQLQGDSRPLADLEREHEIADQTLVYREQGAHIHSRFLAAEREAKKAAEFLAVLETEKRALEELVAWSGPNGLRKQILAANLGPFLQELEGILGTWGLGARYDEAGTLQVATGGAWVAWEELSDSEQLRVGLAHQVAFASLTGLRIVVLDRVEALDAEGQAVLYQTCLQMAAAGQVDHVVLLAVGSWAPVPEEILQHKLEREAVTA